MTNILTETQTTDLESLGLTVQYNSYFEAVVDVPSADPHRIIRKGTVFTLEVGCCSCDHQSIQSVMDEFYALHLTSMARD